MILEIQNKEKEEQFVKAKHELDSTRNHVEESRQLKEREGKIRNKVEDMLAKLEELQLQG